MNLSQSSQEFIVIVLALLIVITLVVGAFLLDERENMRCENIAIQDFEVCMEAHQDGEYCGEVVGELLQDAGCD